MDELQEPTGEGSCVDELKQKKEETESQAADSDPQGSSLVGSQGHGVKCQLDEVAMEAVEDHQDGTCEEQVAVDQKLGIVLQDLKGCVSEECFKYAEYMVKKCNKKIPVPPNDLFMFFFHFVENIRHLKTSQTPDKGGKKSNKKSAGCGNEGVFKSLSLPPFWWYTVRVCSVVTGQTFGADTSILEQVKNVRLSTTKLETTTDLQDCDAIIIFCPVTSRVGSDVEAAMRNTAVSSGEKPVILVVMHHTRDVDYSVDGRKWSEKYLNIKLEVHVLFHETQPGLLKCQINDQAVSQIQKMLYNHSKWR